MNTKSRFDVKFGLVALTLSIILGSFVFGQVAISATGATKDKRAAQITIQRGEASVPLRVTATTSSQANKSYSSAPALQVAVPGDRCEGILGGEPIWLIGGWITGQEVYSAYQDPSVNCPGAYPFSIDTVHVFLDIKDTISVVLPFTVPVAVAIRGLDTTTTPGCILPGPLLFIGSLGAVTFTQKALFDVAIPLDSAFDVTGPYFVDLVLPDSVLPEWEVRLVTDEIEALCVSYNNWDSAIGYVDIGNDTVIHHESNFPEDFCFSAPPNTPGCFDFDGRMLLWSNGVTGGSPPEPEPGIAFVGPKPNERLYGSTDIWVAETSGSPIIDSAVFYQRTAATAWTRIGVDVNQDVAVGRGAAFGAGQGLSYFWDFSSEIESVHWIKVEIFDSLFQKAVDSISVFLEPTPPVPILNAPAYFSRFCDTITLTYGIIDENPSSGLLQKKLADLTYSQTLGTQFQFALGDVDGDTADGNPASQGEFGDFYGALSVGALALRYWHGQGFIQSLRVGGSTLTNAQAAERLATFTNVRINGELNDETFVLGFRQYLLVTGFGELQVDFKRDVSYSALRNWTEDFGVCAMIRIAGTNGGPGSWFAVDGYEGLPVSENSFKVRVSDPSDGTIKTLFWRDGLDGADLFYQNAWHSVDIIVGLIPTNWSISGRSGIGFDFVSGAQWTVVVDSASDALSDGNLYFFIAQVTDQDSNLGEQTILLELNCASFAIGDYDGNGSSNVADLVYLISFQLLGGPAPVGGAFRADTNCDPENLINTADLIFYINWIFAGGAAPCR